MANASSYCGHIAIKTMAQIFLQVFGNTEIPLFAVFVWVFFLLFLVFFQKHGKNALSHCFERVTICYFYVICF